MTKKNLKHKTHTALVLVFYAILIGMVLWFVLQLIVYLVEVLLGITPILSSSDLDGSVEPLPWITLLICIIVAGFLVAYSDKITASKRWKNREDKRKKKKRESIRKEQERNLKRYQH